MRSSAPFSVECRWTRASDFRLGLAQHSVTRSASLEVAAVAYVRLDSSRADVANRLLISHSQDLSPDLVLWSDDPVHTRVHGIVVLGPNRLDGKADVLARLVVL